MSDTVLRETADGVLRLTLNRPDALNSFTIEMKEALAAALKDAARDRDVRALIPVSYTHLTLPTILLV